jgi:hypothetical protein
MQIIVEEVVRRLGTLSAEAASEPRIERQLKDYYAVEMPSLQA